MKQKKSKKARPNISLSKQDVDAILCALPLISYYETEDPLQQEINTTLAESASEKLMAHNSDFLPNEIRVIYAAIACAVNFETHFPGLELDPEWKEELRLHFFTLNRLHDLAKDYIYR